MKNKVPRGKCDIILIGLLSSFNDNHVINYDHDWPNNWILTSKESCIKMVEIDRDKAQAHGWAQIQMSSEACMGFTCLKNEKSSSQFQGWLTKLMKFHQKK